MEEEEISWIWICLCTEYSLKLEFIIWNFKKLSDINNIMITSNYIILRSTWYDLLSTCIMGRWPKVLNKIFVIVFGRIPSKQCCFWFLHSPLHPSPDHSISENLVSLCSRKHANNIHKTHSRTHWHIYKYSSPHENEDRDILFLYWIAIDAVALMYNLPSLILFRQTVADA